MNIIYLMGIFNLHPQTRKDADWNRTKKEG